MAHNLMYLINQLLLALNFFSNPNEMPKNITTISHKYGKPEQIHLSYGARPDQMVTF